MLADTQNLCDCESVSFDVSQAHGDVGQALVMWVSSLWCGSDLCDVGQSPCNVGQSLVMWVSPLWCGSDPYDTGQSLVMWIRPLWCGSDSCDMGQSLVIWVRPVWCGSVPLWTWLHCVLTCSGCSPNTMDVVSGSVGDVVVNYQVHRWNVQTSVTSVTST